MRSTIPEALFGSPRRWTIDAEGRHRQRDSRTARFDQRRARSRSLRCRVHRIQRSRLFAGETGAPQSGQPLPSPRRSQRLPGAVDAEDGRGYESDSGADVHERVRWPANPSVDGGDERERAVASHSYRGHELGACYSPAGMEEGTEDKREDERLNILGELHGEVMVY